MEPPTKTKPKERKYASHILAVLTVVISAVSLSFGAWQYLENRSAERDLRALQLTEQQYQVMKAKVENGAHLEEYYLDIRADLLYWIIGGRNTDVPTTPENGATTADVAYESIKDMMGELRADLGWDSDIGVINTFVLEDIVNGVEHGIPLKTIHLLVLRNEGLYSLTDITLDVSHQVYSYANDQWSSSYEPYRVDVGSLAPRAAVAIPTDFDKSYASFDDASKDHDTHSCIAFVAGADQQRATLSFTDDLTKQRSTRDTRDKRTTTLMVNPNLSLGG
jgi:hypothetical protein